MNESPLLVVAHEATRTGSPRVLANLLAHTARDIPAPIAVRLLAEGPLGAELRSFATADAHTYPPRALVVNGAAAAGVLEDYRADTPCLLYVHEEADALAVLPKSARQWLPRYDRIFCVSERARSDLVALGATAERVEVLPPAVRVTVDRRRAEDPGRVPVIVGCGEAGWRKGADLFIDVARRVCSTRDTDFRWAGRRPRAFARLLDHDTRAAGVEEHLEWLGELNDVHSVFDAATLLVLVSREDPQPLVPLEASGHGVATAGFAIGGIEDLAADGAALTVPFPDTAALADVVIGLLDDADHRRALADAALDRAVRLHSVDTSGPMFLSAVKEILAHR